jgi:hypothetical protein
MAVYGVHDVPMLQESMMGTLRPGVFTSFRLSAHHALLTGYQYVIISPVGYMILSKPLFIDIFFKDLTYG